MDITEQLIVNTPMTSSVLLDHDVTIITDPQTPIFTTPTGSSLPNLDRARLVDVLHDPVHGSTHLDTPLTLSALLPQVSVSAAVNEEKLATVERSDLATTFSLPGILSLSSFTTSSSVNNNNISINCSFTNSSIDSRDDDVYGLHVTFDEDSRPQLRPKDGSQVITGLEFLLEKSASTELPSRVVNEASDSLVVASSSAPTTSTGNVSSVACVVSAVSCGDTGCTSYPAEPDSLPGTLSSAATETSSAETAEAAVQSAPVTPVRKSVRTHRNPLNTAEFVSLDLSPRSRSKTGAGKHPSLDNCNTLRVTPGSRQTRSLPSSQPQSSKSRTKKQRSSRVVSEHSSGLEQQRRSTAEQVPVNSDQKTANSVNSSVSSELGDVKRKRGRPRKSQTAVNGKTGVHHEGVPAASGGSWSSLNSKAAGDSSLGSIGLVSELFSVTSIPPVPCSQPSLPTISDSAVIKCSEQPVQKPDSPPVPSKPQSPVTDLSFTLLDELSSFDQKHKRKKKKKKKKKSCHSSVVDVGKCDSKAADNLDSLVETLRSVQLSSGDVSQPSESLSLDGCRVLAKIFSHDQKVAALRQSFTVRGTGHEATGTSSVPAITGSTGRSKPGRKASPMVDGKPTCLPPKKRHKLEMSSGVSQNVDVGKTQGVGRGRRGRPPKLRTNYLNHKPYVKTSKFCSKLSHSVASVSALSYSLSHVIFMTFRTVCIRNS